MSDSSANSTSDWLPVENKETIRRTQQGQIIGFSNIANDNHIWLGIPYAQPPIGDLRWKAPRPLKAWAGVKKALKTGASSSQQKPSWKNDMLAGNSFTGSTYVGSEDCLYLNIWSPPFSRDDIPTGESRLPVMVWIHGGGNLWHNGDLKGKDGISLVSSQKVILVSMNFRLGAFGWLTHPAFKEQADNAEDASGNFGTLDIIQVLQWVKDNIAAFGGDPNRVTIFGVSAGGWNVMSLLCSPKAKGLFHRAIVQGSWPKTSSIEHAENFIDDRVSGHPQSSNELLLQLLRTDEPVLDRPTAKQRLLSMTASAIVDYLKNKSYEQIERAYLVIEEQVKNDYFTKEEVTDTKLGRHVPESSHSVPRIFCDGYVVAKGGIVNTIQERRHNPVPVILGTTRDESTIFQIMDVLMEPLYVTVDHGKRQIVDQRRYEITNEYQTKLWKALGVDELADTLVISQEQPVFAFRFDWDDWPTINGDDLSLLLGAFHGSETAFLFDMPVRWCTDFPSSSKPVSQALMAYWSEFAYSGHPSRGRSSDSDRHVSLPEWVSWDQRPHSNDKMIVLDGHANGGIRMSGEHANKQQVLDQIPLDKRLDNISHRKQLYWDLLCHSHTFFSWDDYRTVEGGLCANENLTAFTMSQKVN